MMERRKLERRELTYYLRAFDQQSMQVLGLVANISPDGFMVIGDCEIKPNSEYSFKIPLPAAILSKQILEIRAISRWSRTRQSKESFATGFQLTKVGQNDLEIVRRICSDPAFRSRDLFAAKRVFDLMSSFLGIALLAPLLVFIAILTKLVSPGPALYRAKRVGRYGRIFTMYKFRSMIEKPGEIGPRITAHDDPRVTRLGRFLRQTKLNELPQLLNVLKGDMSFVGPRPEDVEVVPHYTPEQREVLSVRPGITSLAAILYADEEKMLNFSNVTETYLRKILPDKLRLDLLYIRNQSLLLDLDILLRTILVLIPRFRKATPRVEEILTGPIRSVRRNLPLFVVDAAIILLSMSVAGALWRTTGPLVDRIGPLLIAAIMMTVVFSVANWILGMQRVWWRYATSTDASYVVLSASISAVVVLLVNAIAPWQRFPAEMLVVASFFALAGFLTARFHRTLFAQLRHRITKLKAIPTSARERVLVVGGGESGRLTIWLMRTGAAASVFDVVGVVDDDLDKLGTLVNRVPVLGQCDRVADIVREYEIGTIAFSIDDIDQQRRSRILALCSRSKARVVSIPNIVTLVSRGTQRASDRQLQSDSTATSQLDSTQAMEMNLDLRHRISDLAELARSGNLAEAIDHLQKLDQTLRGLDEAANIGNAQSWSLHFSNLESNIAIDASQPNSEDISNRLSDTGSSA